ncbi:MAG: STAS domain-containing protein [Solirubrobacteraceae bacterium]
MTDDPGQHKPSPEAELIELGQFSMRSERDGDVHRIRLFGELDLSNAGDVERELERVEATDARSIVVDLSGLTFMDSTGVRLLVTAHARSREEDESRLTLVRGPVAVQRVLQLSGVEALLPFGD